MYLITWRTVQWAADRYADLLSPEAAAHVEPGHKTRAQLTVRAPDRPQGVYTLATTAAASHELLIARIEALNDVEIFR